MSSSFHQTTASPLATFFPPLRQNLQLHLFPCIPLDIPPMKAIFFAALDDPLCRTIWPPSSPQAHEWWTQALTYDLRNEGARCVKVVAVESSSPSKEGDTIAFGNWEAPNDEVDLAQARGETVPQWPVGDESVNKMADGYFMGAKKRMLRLVRGDRARGVGRGQLGHWLLDTIGTLSEYRGLGAEGEIIRWGIEQAECEDRACYLDSTPKAVKLYQRYGFEDRERIDVMVREGVPFYSVQMVRYPQKSS